MSGVAMDELIYCPVCKAKTQHATNWDSEEPNVIDVQCIPCYGNRWISGMALVTRVGKDYHSRVLTPEHQKALGYKL